ncbi:MAG TPA: hypothetical protein VMT88_10470 [Actinomycetes bacterium]|nr:hypothetical protein [Actinomycetes bacterium]
MPDLLGVQLGAVGVCLAILTAGCSGTPTPLSEQPTPAKSHSVSPMTDTASSDPSSQIKQRFTVIAVRHEGHALKIELPTSMCQPFREVNVRRSKQLTSGMAEATRVTTISVLVSQAPAECIGGIGPELTKVVRSRWPMVGCSAKVVDGATGRPAKFTRDAMRGLVWSCPAQLVQ